MKYHPRGSVLFCTLSIEEGLLLLCNPLCEGILKSCLGSAVQQYPVKVCHFLVEATHVHIVLVVENPEDVPRFVRHFKCESAHMLNRLLGRRKRTVWCEGYDSPIVLTPVRTLVAISYLYSNPAKDNLESSIERYPGFSSWEMFIGGKNTQEWKRLRRDQFEALRAESHNLRGYTQESNRVQAASEESVLFTLFPNAWLEAFGITDAAEQSRWNQRIEQRVRLIEARSQRLREQKRHRVLGAQRLIQQRFDLTYRPQRSGRRTWCLSERRSDRQTFIGFFKALMTEAREVLSRWRLGDLTAKYPPGLHPPSMPRLANVLPYL